MAKKITHTKVRFSLAIPPELAIKIDTQCHKEQVVRNSWMIDALEFFLLHKQFEGTLPEKMKLLEERVEEIEDIIKNNYKKVA